MSAKMIKCKSCNNDISSEAKACPNCGAKVKKPIYKKWWFWLIIVVLFIGIIGASGNGESGTSTSGENHEQQTAASIVVSADELIRAYVNNTVTADELYKNKNVTVSGTIYSIDEGYVTIEPDADDLWLNNIYVYYDSGEKSKLADYSKGDKITVTGECKGEGIFGLEIKYCVIE